MAIKGNNAKQKITLHIEVTGDVFCRFKPPIWGHARIPSPFTFQRIVNVESHGARIITAIRAAFNKATVEWSAERCEEFLAFKALRDSRDIWRMDAMIKNATEK